MRLWVPLLGTLLILFALRDLFHTIWHPTRRGGISRLVMSALWRLSGLLPAGRRWRSLAGPLGMALVVAMWTFGIVLGWALVYLPHMPEGFDFQQGMEPSERSDLLDSVYLSLVYLATLGLGDIAPTEGWLRIVAPLEFLVGFLLLSAVVSWVLGVYPALARRKALAIRLDLLRNAGLSDESLSNPHGARLLEGLATAVVHVRVDFSQYPETYYFHDREKQRGSHGVALAEVIGFAADLAHRGRRAGREDVRLSDELLAGALGELAATLDRSFLHTGGGTGAVLHAYAAEHEPESVGR